MTRNRLGRRRSVLPPKKPIEAHKVSVSISLDPARRRWLRENFDRLNYRNESHMVDDLIRRSMEAGLADLPAPKDKKSPEDQVFHPLPGAKDSRRS